MQRSPETWGGWACPGPPSQRRICSLKFHQSDAAPDLFCRRTMQLTHISSGLRTSIATAGRSRDPFPYVTGTNTLQTVGPPKSPEATVRSARSEFQQPQQPRRRPTPVSPPESLRGSTVDWQPPAVPSGFPDGLVSGHTGFPQLLPANA